MDSRHKFLYYFIVDKSLLKLAIVYCLNRDTQITYSMANVFCSTNKRCSIALDVMIMFDLLQPATSLGKDDKCY